MPRNPLSWSRVSSSGSNRSSQSSLSSLNSRSAASRLASTSDPSTAIRYAFTGPSCPINDHEATTPWSRTIRLPGSPLPEVAEQRQAVRPVEPAGVPDEVGVVGEAGVVRRWHHAGEVLDLRERVLDVDDRKQPRQRLQFCLGKRPDRVVAVQQ